MAPFGFVPGLDRGHPHRLEHAAGQSPQGDGGVWRSPHGGADLGDRLSPSLGQYRHGVDRFQLALGRAHSGSGVALEKLDGVVPLCRRSHQVFGVHVFGEVDDAVGGGAEQGRMGVAGQREAGIARPLGLPMGPVTVHRHSPGRCRLETVGRHPRPGGGQVAGGPGVLDELVQAAVAGDAAGRQHVVDPRRSEEPGYALVVDGSISRHVEQRGGRGPAGCGNQQGRIPASCRRPVPRL